MIFPFHQGVEFTGVAGLAGHDEAAVGQETGKSLAEEDRVVS